MTMTRRFPPYTAVDLDPRHEPVNYETDGSKRCVVCNQRWPNNPNFNISPCCEAQALHAPEVPSMSWADAVRSLIAWKFEKYYEKSYSGTNEEQQEWLSDPLSINEDEVNQGMEEITEQIDELTQE